MITVYFMMKDCKKAFIGRRVPMFSKGGGSYQQFGGSALEMKQRHFYFFKWCILTIRYDRLPRRRFAVGFGSAYDATVK